MLESKSERVTVRCGVFECLRKNSVEEGLGRDGCTNSDQIFKQEVGITNTGGYTRVYLTHGAIHVDFRVVGMSVTPTISTGGSSKMIRSELQFKF